MRELLGAGRRKVHDLWLAADADDARRCVDEIAGSREAARVRVRRVPGDQMQRRARTEAPQGVVAFAAPMPTADLDELLSIRARFSSPSTV